MSPAENFQFFLNGALMPGEKYFHDKFRCLLFCDVAIEGKKERKKSFLIIVNHASKKLRWGSRNLIRNYRHVRGDIKIWKMEKSKVAFGGHFSEDPGELFRGRLDFLLITSFHWG